MTRGILSLLLLAMLALTLYEVRAEPLDAATCGQLKGEQVRMEQGGVRGSMAKGPEWAKANLAADKLDQIRRLIELDEQLLFRCSSRNLVELPPEADADPAPAKADEDGKDAATAKTEAPAPPKGKPATAKAAPAPAPKAPDAKAQPKAAAKTPPGVPKAAPAKKPEPAKAAAGAAPAPDKAPAAKPKPKVKVDDAYKAPPPNPNVDPFANQPARQ